MKLLQRVAVVSGAGSGIGRVIARGLAAEGAQVAIIGRREDRLRETAEPYTSQFLIVPGDVREPDAVERLRQTVLERFGRCDILVNNAGVSRPPAGTLLHESTLDDWEQVMNTNLRGAFLMLRAFIPIMIEQHYGRVINLTSGLKHAPGHGVYSISKSGIDSLTKTVAHELEKHNILVNTLNPGWVRTEMAPNAPDDPQKVIPLALQLATLPDGEPTGVEYHV